ncbi:family 16 glycoside hydrolase [Neorhodopirellula lusitana]|uniref:family 16 glycoside hydrolase n=1 Tax=Neorhodopirellula lusitana TaxID=445327 RepID=UPI00384D1DFA
MIVLHIRRIGYQFLSLIALFWIVSGLDSSLVAWGQEPTQTNEVSVDDPDYPIQGEYAGDHQAMQVIAAGDGEFELVLYEGGLPGAGAKPTPPRRIEGDAELVEELVESMELQRVERISPTLGVEAPADGIVLFDGTQEAADKHWSGGQVSDEGLLLPGTTTKATFQDYSLHVEFRTPWEPTRSGQQRGNSGVYHQARYETQILDSFGLEGLNNEAGGIYELHAPAVNACLPPMTWQTYDIDFTAARFDDAGTKTADARLTVRLNGILVQDDVSLARITRAAPQAESPDAGPIYLQDHRNAVRFRNIWIVPRDADREAGRPIVPGFERFFAGNTKTLADGGELLLNSLACDACHSSASVGLPAQRGPDLSEVAGRVRPDALLAMVTDPHGAKPGTTMPDPWVGVSEADRSQRSQAIASFLALSGKVPLLDQAVSREVAQRGKSLYQEVGCVACHASDPGDASTVGFTSVPLVDLHQKYTLRSLSKFLQAPHEVRPGLRMPALTGSPDEATAIAAYLTEEVTVGEETLSVRRSVYRGFWKQMPDFTELEPESQDLVSGLKFDDIRPKNGYGVVFEAMLSVPRDDIYVFELSSDDGSNITVGKRRLNNDGIHARTTRKRSIALTAGAHPIRVEFFNAGGGAELDVEIVDPISGKFPLASWLFDENQTKQLELLPSEFKPDASLVETGKQWFRSTGCANCHKAHELTSTMAQAPSLEQSRAGQGCLAEEVQSPAMDFGLGSVQRAALTAAIERRQSGGVPEVDDANLVHLTMAALNCYACHARDQKGGAERGKVAFFQTTTPEMGLEGQVPPPLDGVGDKLNDAYFKSVLDNGANIRPYMKVRMPGFQYEPLQALHAAFNSLDRRDEMKTADHSQDAETVVSTGRQLCGNAGLACIKCHSFGGEKGGGIGAIDMLKMPERLRVEWFHRYLQDPVAYRPGTRMPNSFPDGKSALVDIYGGDPTLQIDAIWKYLQQGEKAEEPEGLKQGAIVLTPDQRPRIYRNFFVDVTARGIGVGYPEKVNLIWDAEEMNLAMVWENSFVDASLHWVGRGQGRQKPLGDRLVAIDPATPFAVLESKDEAWPQSSGRELGYRFRGYRLDQLGRPAFQYSIGSVAITDAPRPQVESRGMVRNLKLDTTGDAPDGLLVWQPATGRIEPTERGFRINGRVEMIIEGVDCELVSSGGQQTLRAVIPAGGLTQIQQTILW